jgi:LAS superfamily LD-carboxypeptidase LdcB
MKKLYLFIVLLVTSSELIIAKSWYSKAKSTASKTYSTTVAAVTNVVDHPTATFKTVGDAFKKGAQDFDAEVQKLMATTCPSTPPNVAPVIQTLPSITMAPTVVVTNNSIAISDLPSYLASITTMTPEVISNLQANATMLQTNLTSFQSQVKNLLGNNEKMIKDNGSIGGVLGAAAGAAFAVGTLGSTPPCVDIAAGAAIGAVIGVEAVDGAKITCNNRRIKDLNALITIVENGLLPINALLLSKLTITQLQALTPAQLQAYSDDIVIAMIPCMTPSQITSINSKYITNISQAGLQFLNKEQVQAIPASHIAAMTPDMTPADNEKITAAVTKIKQMSAQWDKKPGAAAETLVKSIMDVLGVIGSYLTKNAVTAQIAQFDPHQFRYMTKEQVLRISPLQLQVITGAQFANIDPEIIPFMTDAQIAFTSPFQWIAITADQRKKLTAAQITSLAFMQFAQQVVGYVVTPACFGGSGMVI